MKYRKQGWPDDRTIDAVQWDGLAATADAFVGAGQWQYAVADPPEFRHVDEIPKAVAFAINLGSSWRPSIVIQTQAGGTRVEPGDYIVHGTSGKLIVVKAKEFERAYCAA